MADANIRAVITAEDRASKTIKGFGDNTAKVSNKVKLAIAGASVALLGFADSSLKAFEAQENAEQRLRGAIINVTSARSKNVDGLIKQAAALQQVTRFSDESIISAQGILATYQLNQQQIESLTPHLIDMAEGMAEVSGTMPDLEQNAKLVAKAVGGQDTDSLVGVLRRANIMLTNHQQEVLKTGTFQQRMSEITKVLDMNVGGLGEKMGKTTSGQIAIFNHNLDETKEKIGGLIAQALDPLLKIFIKYPIILKLIIPAVLALTAAFIGLKVAAAIGIVMAGARTAILSVGAAAVKTRSSLILLQATSRIPLIIPVAAALASLTAVYFAAQSVLSAIRAVNQASNSVSNAGTSNDAVISRLQALIKSGTPTQRTAAKKALLGLAANNSFASGVTNFEGGLAYVHQGELLANLPKGTDVIPKNKVESMSPSVINHISFNGIFTGSEMEFRKLAIKVFQAGADVAGMQNNDITSMTTQHWRRA